MEQRSSHRSCIIQYIHYQVVALYFVVHGQTLRIFCDSNRKGYGPSNNFFLLCNEHRHLVIATDLKSYLTKGGLPERDACCGIIFKSPLQPSPSFWKLQVSISASHKWLVLWWWQGINRNVGVKMGGGRKMGGREGRLHFDILFWTHSEVSIEWTFTWKQWLIQSSICPYTFYRPYTLSRIGWAKLISNLAV